MAKKRSHGEGSLSRKANGRWEIQIMDGFKSNGRRNIRSFSGKTQKEAKEKRDEFLRKKAMGIITGHDMRFEEWADIWYENHKENVTATTQEGYKYTRRILKDHFGRRKLAEIKTMDVEQFLRKLKKEGRASSYIAQCRGMLHQIMDKAVANDFLVKNPVAYADKMRKDPPKAKEAFTADEMRALFRDLPDNKIGWSIRLMIATGMRPQEMLGLEPRHIAFDGSSINIAQAVVRVKGTVTIGTPKSYDSYRTIPVPELVRYCARNLRSTEDKFVWQSPKKPNSPCNLSYFSKLFKEAIGTVEGVRVLTPHCCRHTFITQMIALGVDPKTVQSIAGHAKIDMTLYYAHAAEPQRQEAIQRFSEAFSKNGKGTFGNVLDIMDHLKSS